MEALTFENLPQAVTKLTKDISELKRLLIEKQETQTPQQPELLTIDEAAALLSISKFTIYSKVSRNEIPGVCKQGKRLYFESKVLIDWIKSGRRKTDAEIESEAINELKQKNNAV